MLFKSLLTSAYLLGVSLAVSASGPAAESKGKPCCGCDTSKAAERAKRQTEYFVGFLTEGQLWRANELTTSDFTVYQKLYCDFVPIPAKLEGTCCESMASLADSYLPTLFGQSFNTLFYNDASKLNYDGSVTTTFDAVVYIGDITYAFNMRFQWVPANGCNYLLEAVFASDKRCDLQVPITTTGCPFGCTITSTFLTVTGTTTTTTFSTTSISTDSETVTTTSTSTSLSLTTTSTSVTITSTSTTSTSTTTTSTSTVTSTTSVAGP